MRKVWVHKAKSFHEASQFDLSYYASMSPSKRLETVQYMREGWLQFRKNSHGKYRKRLRRVFKIIKQA